MSTFKIALLSSLLAFHASSYAVEEAAQTKDKLESTAGGKAVKELLKDPKKAPENQKFDPAAIKDQYAKEPGFSSDSADQEEKDKIVEANQEVFSNLEKAHVQELYRCGRIGNAEAAKECRKEATIKKAKK